MKELEPYFAAYARASDRTRSVYFIILTVSVICLATSLKSMESGWNARTMRKVKLAYVYLKTEYPVQKDPIYEKLSPTEIQEAKEFQALVKFRTADDAKSSLEAAKRRISDGNQFTIPLFGLSFHPNDLGLIAGVCLFILLLILKQALSREQENFQLGKEKATELTGEMKNSAGSSKQENIYKYTYDLLSTYEVLHRPEALRGSAVSFFSRMWIDVSMVMLCFPVLAYAIVFSSDYRTREIGFVLSPQYTKYLLTFEIFALVSIIYLVFSCYMIVRETRNFWFELRSDAQASADEIKQLRVGKPQVNEVLPAIEEQLA